MPATPATYTVETGRDAGPYRHRYEFPKFTQAWTWYAGINTHSGGKKRLRRHWKGRTTTLVREITRPGQ